MRLIGDVSVDLVVIFDGVGCVSTRTSRPDERSLFAFKTAYFVLSEVGELVLRWFVTIGGGLCVGV